MKRVSIGLMTAAAFILPTQAMAQQVVPTGPGNAQGPAPLRYYGSGGSHVQQIYSSGSFTGPQSISAISFRAYPGAAPSGFFSNTVNVSDIIISAGTATASGNDTSGLPSDVFANNLLNPSVVYSGALSLTTAATGTGDQPFDYTIMFDTPFLYDPAAGSLLLDFLIPGSATVSGSGFGFLTFDTANTIDDGVYSVVDIFNGNATSGTLSTAGAITRFTSADAGAVPEPATWAMMLMGFGAVGVGMRRSRRRKGELLQIA